MKLIDCCMFNGEEIIKMRLEYSYNFFDTFYFIESWYTFTGKRKEFLYCEKYADWFAPYKDKIKFHILNELVSVKPFTQEEYQRNSIVPRILEENDDALVFFSDCDEFYDFSKLPPKEELLKLVEKKPILFFSMKLYYCRFTHLYEKIKWTTAFLIHTSKLRLYRNIQKIRIERVHDGRYIPPNNLENGWHFSFFMSLDEIVRKIESFSHQEINTPKYKDKAFILKAVAEGKDIFNRNLPMKVLPFEHPIHGFPDIFKKYENYIGMLDLPKDLVAEATV